MTDPKFQGVFTALLTPFDASGKINAKELEKLVEFNIRKGVSGFYVCGSTAEAFLMTKEERMQVLEIVKSAARDCTVIAHVGSLIEDDALQLARHAERMGCDAVSSVTPFYYKFSLREIQDYYFRLADASSLPMLMYYIPALSGVNMGVGDMERLLSDGRVLGVKYTSNDFFTMERCRSAFPDKIVYNGYDEMFLSGLPWGPTGAWEAPTTLWRTNSFGCVLCSLTDGWMRPVRSSSRSTI